MHPIEQYNEEEYDEFLARCKRLGKHKWGRGDYFEHDTDIGIIFDIHPYNLFGYWRNELQIIFYEWDPTWLPTIKDLMNMDGWYSVQLSHSHLLHLRVLRSIQEYQGVKYEH
jgi:hypothetical protein